MAVSKKLIHNYLESLGDSIVSVGENKIIKRNKKQLLTYTSKKQEEINSDCFNKIENTCDNLIKNIDKLIELLK